MRLLNLYHTIIVVLICTTIIACSPDNIDNGSCTPQTPGAAVYDPLKPLKPDPVPTPEPEKPQNPDSLAFMWAKRIELEIGSAKGFVITGTIFEAVQNISVIIFSKEDFTIKTILPDKLTEVSAVATENNAAYAINAAYWTTSTGQATTMIKIDGEILSKTHDGWYPRVNGLLYIYEDRIEIEQSYAYPYYDGLIEKCDNVIACGPVLLDDSAIISYNHITESEEANMQSKIPFFTNRHPRSVIGRDNNGNIYFIVVDGRAKGDAEGMSIHELTQICAWLGLTEAMNLDGGGSSTLWCKELGVINHPCDNKKFDHEGERKVSSTIVAIQK